jgi:serine/threonine protein kinase
MIGRYLVLSQLGQGGMGIVFAAHDPELDRQVAIKLVRDPLAARGTQRIRLMREARALARLNHTNVVTVHDVGVHDDQIYVAMELVDGTTFGQWCKQEPRTLRAKLDVLLAAGRGLAVAHAAGLVHRDFKPDNVMVSAEGGPASYRVRVMDFGLVRAAAPEPISQAGDDARDQPLGLTHAGALLGTPKYMAPEQFLGQPTDARADQFSYCVTVWEALYGERPFRAASLHELATTVIEGRIASPARRTGIAGAIEQALRRGLATDPAARFPTMDELLAVLARDPTRRRRTIAAVAIGAGLLGAVIVGAAVQQHRARAACVDAGGEIAAIWPGRADEVDAAITATGLSFAAQTWERVQPWVRSYADDWSRVRAETCLAQLEHERSPELDALSRDCLEQRRDELASLLDGIAGGDRLSVENAVSVAARLPRIDTCADDAWLLRQVPLPEDPETRARIVALRRELARANDEELLGRYAGAAARVRPLIEEAESIGWQPLVASAHRFLGSALERGGAFEEAEPHFRRAFMLASECSDDETAAIAASDLVFTVGGRQPRYAEALLWLDLAEMSVGRLGDRDGVIAAGIASVATTMHRKRGALPEALASGRRAVSLYESAFGPVHPAVATALDQLATALVDAGEFDDALELGARVLEMRRTTLGDDHPLVGLALANLGFAHYEGHQYDEGDELLRQAVEALERSVGPDDLDIAGVLNTRGIIAWHRGDLEAARRFHERALAIRRSHYNGFHPDVAQSINSIALVHAVKGEYGRALPLFEEALLVWQGSLGASHPVTATALLNIANVHQLLGRPGIAKGYAERALQLRESNPALRPEELAEVLLTLGTIHADLGENATAGAELERARAIYEADPALAPQLAEVQAALARVR